VEARIRHDGRLLNLDIDGADHRRGRRRRRKLDSLMEEDLARVLRDKIGDARDGWTLVREDALVMLRGGSVFLPDFTLRHHDGREALVELVGYWTPEYLAEKLRKVGESGLDNLVLVVSRRLGVGATALAEASEGPVVWFTDRPSARPVLEAAERVAR
jgi:predicted nuclease of restriction endonuclease-like RecB superfamily